MGQVVVTVCGRGYAMQCADGEEEHLAELAQLIDQEVTTIQRSVGQVGDTRLLLMAGLVIADKLAEGLRRIEELQDQIASMRVSRNGAVKQGQELEEKVAERLEAATRRLEAVTRETAPREQRQHPEG